MASPGDRILLVEHDPETSDIIARQALKSVGYQVDVVPDASAAIKHSVQAPPDLIIADLNLPGLSAKDLIVALTSQSVNTPVMVIANKGQEQDIIQAFRLGAADYLLWPARDAEVLSAVERILRRVHERHDRQRLDMKLGQANQELKRKARELAALLNIGQAVTSITDQPSLFQKIVDGAIQASDANIAWLQVRNDESREFLLSAQRGLPDALAGKMNQALDDGISGLVAQSGEVLSISGEPLLKFRVARLGRSVCAVPIKVRKEVIGVLVVVRRAALPFEKEEQRLLEAVADHASISLLNFRLFRALEETVQSSRESGKIQGALLESLRNAVAADLKSAIQPIDLLLTEMTGNLTEHQREALKAARSALQRMERTAEKTRPPIPLTLKKQ